MFADYIGSDTAVDGNSFLCAKTKITAVSFTDHIIRIIKTEDRSPSFLSAFRLQRFTPVGDGTITLTGSGTYDLGSGIASLGTGVSLGANWAGTVILSGITSANGLDLNKFGNASSTVKLNGVKGWFDRTYETGADKDKSV